MKFCTKEPMTLLGALNVMYPDSSNKSLRDMLKNKRVSVDDAVVVRADHALEPEQQVCVGKVPRTLDQGIQLLYQDRHLIAINKPIGLLSVPLDSEQAKNALEILRDYFHTSHIYAVHRLDRDSSGVMIFARGKQADTVLCEMFKKHDLKREYVAVVEGRMQESEGVWESYLQELSNYRVQSTDNLDEGKKAVTHYSVIRRSKNFSFLRLRLETGKKHQIRVHCQEAGYPIAGDKLYGSPFCDPISRLCLHALLLEFNHPITSKPMSFSASLPGPFARLGVPNLI